jgi:steroid delta-isomerase-like uncharacterized protein
MPHDYKKSVLCLLDKVWSHGELAAIDGLIASHYQIHCDPGDPWEGKILDIAEYANRVTILRAPFPDQIFHVNEIMEEDSKVIVTWNWHGTHKLSIADIPASNKSISMTGATVYYCKDGYLCGHWQITDRLGVFRQLKQ